MLTTDLSSLSLSLSLSLPTVDPANKRRLCFFFFFFWLLSPPPLPNLQIEFLSPSAASRARTRPRLWVWWPLSPSPRGCGLSRCKWSIRVFQTRSVLAAPATTTTNASRTASPRRRKKREREKQGRRLFFLSLSVETSPLSSFFPIFSTLFPNGLQERRRRQMESLSPPSPRSFHSTSFSSKALSFSLPAPVLPSPSSSRFRREESVPPFVPWNNNNRQARSRRSFPGEN